MTSRPLHATARWLVSFALLTLGCRDDRIVAPPAATQPSTADLRVITSRGSLNGELFADLGQVNGQGPEVTALSIDGSVAVGKVIVRNADGTSPRLAVRWTAGEGLR